MIGAAHDSHTNTPGLVIASNDVPEVLAASAWLQRSGDNGNVVVPLVSSQLCKTVHIVLAVT